MHHVGSNLGTHEANTVHMMGKAKCHFTCNATNTVNDEEVCGGFIGAVMGMCHMWTAAWMNSCDEFVKKKDPDDRMEIIERGASLFRGAMTVFDGCHGSHSTTSNVHQFSKQFLPT